MCGRYTIICDISQLALRFLIDPGLLAPHHARYNVAPSQVVLAVVAAPDGSRLPAWPRWGIVPSWSKEPKLGPINAVSETVGTKPMFRNAVRHRRCLVVADSFFEWATSEGGSARMPFRFALKSEEPFGFAGLWERWISPTGDELMTCCILTTRPNGLVARVHDRMPVIVRPELEGLWLDPAVTDPAALTPVYEPYPADALVAYPVSRAVNNPKNDTPACIQPSA